MTEWLRHIGTDKIAELIKEEGNIPEIFDYLSAYLKLPTKAS